MLHCLHYYCCTSTASSTTSSVLQAVATYVCAPAVAATTGIQNHCLTQSLQYIRCQAYSCIGYAAATATVSASVCITIAAAAVAVAVATVCTHRVYSSACLTSVCTATSVYSRCLVCCVREKHVLLFCSFHSGC
jgi:hypothetical protein